MNEWMNELINMTNEYKKMNEERMNESMNEWITE